MHFNETNFTHSFETITTMMIFNSHLMKEVISLIKYILKVHIYFFFINQSIKLIWICSDYKKGAHTRTIYDYFNLKPRRRQSDVIQHLYRRLAFLHRQSSTRSGYDTNRGDKLRNSTREADAARTRGYVVTRLVSQSRKIHVIRHSRKIFRVVPLTFAACKNDGNLVISRCKSHTHRRWHFCSTWRVFPEHLHSYARGHQAWSRAHFTTTPSLYLQPRQSALARFPAFTFRPEVKTRVVESY